MDDRAAIVEVQTRHGLACDRRDWDLFEQVYTADVTGRWGGGARLGGRAAIVAMVRAHLGGCGPTQHLHGNHRVEIDGATARAVCAVRAYHVGIGPAAGLTYECLGEYHDELVRTAAGWRIAHREFQLAIEVGTRDVLRPAG